MEKVTLQMFSVAAQAKGDFPCTLKRAAEAGYTGFEFAMNHYGGLDPAELAALMERVGLMPVSAHIQLEAVEEALPYATAVGIRTIVVPTYDFRTYAETVALARRLGEVGGHCREKGLRLAYHNHNFEFLPLGESTFYGCLLENTDPELVSFQLDVGWAANAGADCLALLRQYAGRFSSIHVRECGRVDGPAQREDFTGVPVDENGMFLFTEEQKRRRREQRSWNVPLGQGIVPWGEIVAAANRQGAEDYIVEREIYSGPVFECLRDDCRFLKSLPH